MSSEKDAAKKGRARRLAPDDYNRRRREVLARDNWRCQRCGRGENLDVHHIERRSRSGLDCEWNLITLCRHCHSRVHHET